MLRTLILCALLLTSSFLTSFSAFALNPVPGEKIDHNGLVINPTPQNLTLTGSTVDLSKGFKPVGMVKDFIALVPELKCDKNGVKIEAKLVKDSKGNENAVENKSGAYTLEIDRKAIKIAAYDKRGVFYALQTLRQIIAGGGLELSQIPTMVIKDYPTLNDRGVVEGFYGNPWSHQLRLSLIDFFGRNKLNVYIYGPKDDPYHNCPDWREPYPEKEAQQIKELVDACGRNFVDFVWAIHPGQDYQWNDEDYALLIAKLESMYDLGVRRFALFFDDINGEGANPHKQTKLLNRITEEFVKTHPGVYPLAICPTDYTMIWAKPGEEGALAIFGRELLPEISVMWTGEVVCGDITPKAIEFINSRTKRPAYIWWNFPVQDYCRDKVLQGPAYGLDPNFTSNDLTAFVNNPMEHGEASKLAIYSVADYAWNPKAYNALDSWERGIVDRVPEASEAYRRFAIHSCDTESGYHRDESWETQTFTLEEWSDNLADALEQEFIQIENTPEQLRTQSANKALIAELDPWLDQMAALGSRGRKVIDLARQYRALPEQLDSLEAARFWEAYLNVCMTPQEKESYALHKLGTLKLQPFYNRMLTDMGKGLYMPLFKIIQKEGVEDNQRFIPVMQNLLENVSIEGLSEEQLKVPAFLALVDCNPATSYIIDEKRSINLKKGTDKLLILSGKNSNYSVVEFDEEGNEVKMTTVNKPFTIIEIQPSTKSIEPRGTGEIFEIIENGYEEPQYAGFKESIFGEEQK